MAIVVKNLHANARYARDVGLIPGSRRSPGELVNFSINVKREEGLGP